MCNLYSLTKGQAAIRDWFRAGNDRTGNLPLFPGIFPDQMAPIVRDGTDGSRELVMARWGMPGPPQFGGAPITNIRNVGSPHWRGWLGKHNRCIVPATSFCEYADTKPRKTPKWFALGQDRPLFAFAGRRARQLKVSMSCSDFSRQKRMPSSPQFIPRRCLSF
jgi:putative SOS response-associated peptidase YedK